MQLVSVLNTDLICGLFHICIDRATRSGYGMYVCNLSYLYTSFLVDEELLTTRFALDFRHFILYLFNYMKLNKIKFKCAKNNPANKMYEKFIQHYDGRLVGIYEKDCMLPTGEIVDICSDELFRENFLNKYKGRLRD